ncbi:MAG: glycosyltransferase family 39 protein, partial [Deltaproteobacteria bacterium]|nr:glycosyltransferase family 39 protein [Deltaproteobacteria bacterium]
MSNFRSLLFSLFCAVIAALIGLGLSVRTPIVPGAAGEPAEGLYADGWLAQESEIDLGDFTPFLTLLEFSFNPWRPGGPAELHFHLCGEEIGKVLVTSDEPVRVRYSTYCKNAELTIKAANPFVPSESDPRLLAAQIKYVKVASPVGLPLVNPLIVLAVSIPIFLIQSMLGILFPALLRPAFYLAFSLGAVLVLSSTFDLNLSPLFPMTGFLALCAAGVLLASRLPPFSRIETGRSDNRESNVYTAAAMAVTAGALALRLYEIGFGLPLNYHPDEVPKVNAVMRMYSSGTLNPEYFLHPSLLLYSTYAMNLLLQLFLPDTQFQDSLNLAGRMVSVISGTLSVYLVYLIGRTIFSNLSGILGAVFLAAAPLHVTCSRYLKEDALLVFMILWATYLVVKSVEEDRPRLLLLAGLVAGLSASSKYSGLLTAAAVAAAPWLRSKSLLPDRAWIKPALLALLLFPVGFIAASPYSIIDITTFIEDFSYEKRHMEKGHASVIDAWSQYWTYYYSRVLGPGIGWPVLAVGTLMFGVAAWARAPKLLFVAGAVLLFYLPA